MLPLLISTLREDAAAPQLAPEGEGCVYCGLSAGAHGDGPRCCALCHLVRHLERPRIDDELHLIWLPEISQAALICIVREMHAQLHAKGQRPDATSCPGIVTREGQAIHFVRAALLARTDVAAGHLGTNLPSELAHCLARMPRGSYDRRHRLLGGLRALPAGQFFAGSDDVYPRIVESWRKPEPAANADIPNRSTG